MPTIQVLQDVQTRLERGGGGGGGGADREQRGRNEGGREKCASLNTHTNIKTSMYGCVSSTSSKKENVAVHHCKTNVNSLNPSLSKQTANATRSAQNVQ